MKPSIFGAALALVLAGAARAQAPVIIHGPKAAADAVIKAEQFYSDRVGQVGIAKGMSEFIDPKDGLAFTGGDPARGADAVFAAYGGAAPSTLTLSWTPVEVFAADSGDMAASWGRFKVVSTSGKAKPATGRYVTVWRKTAGGEWKAIMDIGDPDR